MNIFELAAELDIKLDKDGLFECPHGGCGWAKGLDEREISLIWILDTCPKCMKNFKKYMNKKVKEATKKAIAAYPKTLQRLSKPE